MRHLFFGSVCLIALFQNIRGQQTFQQSLLKKIAEWKELEFIFPSEEVKNSAIREGKYVAGNSVPIDVDVFYPQNIVGQKIFVTIPRFQTGVPVTLGTLTQIKGNGGPMIEPYPDYSWHNTHGKDCNGLTSVFRVAIDKCNRMWVLDSGRIGDDQLCSPQLVLFSLETNKVIHRYRFPENQYKSGISLFITPIVDVRDPPPGKCQDTMVYSGDVERYGIVVYNYRLNKSWRVQNKLMYPTPEYGTITVSGESFDLMDGILAMTISPPNSESNSRLLYFHTLASTTEISVPLSVLDDYKIWENNPNAETKAFVSIGSRGMQRTLEAMDRNGNMFFGLTSPNAISCWDSSKPYNKANMRIVAENDLTLQFPSGVKVIVNRRGTEELWVLTSRIQKLMADTYNWKEPNFRVFALPIEPLIGGNHC